jgi:hypothetical protein
MKFTRYLDALTYCRYNKISHLQIERHGEYWNCWWTVSKQEPKGESCPD